jgi:uncharacterized RDD family membrane protein YckC
MTAVQHDRLIIRLSEGVSFSHALAGPVTRAAAFLTDVCVIGLLSSAAGYAAWLMNIFSQDLSGGLTIISYFAISAGYGIACEYWWRGQTLGKWLLGLRVIDVSGLELQFGQVAVRNILRPVDMLPFFGLAGAASILATHRKQRLGDLAAGTVVIRTLRHHAPDLDALAPARFNSLRAYPITCARLRQKCSPELASIAAEALIRRDGLDARCRVLIFDELSAQFKQLADIPEASVESLSSEQFVRNVSEVLYFRPGRAPVPPPLKPNAASTQTGS